MNTSKKENKTNSDSLEEMFARHGIKVVRVHKTGCSVIFTNRPILKNK